MPKVGEEYLLVRAFPLFRDDNLPTIIIIQGVYEDKVVYNYANTSTYSKPLSIWESAVLNGCLVLATELNKVLI